MQEVAGGAPHGDGLRKALSDGVTLPILPAVLQAILLPNPFSDLKTRKPRFTQFFFFFSDPGHSALPVILLSATSLSWELSHLEVCQETQVLCQGSG